MPLSKSRKFLYTRIALLVSFTGWLIFSALGFLGFPYWYGGFVFCFWTAFGILNLKQRSSLWLLFDKPRVFGIFYAALAALSFIVDQFGRVQNLWFYPLYHGATLSYVMFFIYPLGALAVLELVYFLTGFLGEPLSFWQQPVTKKHKALDLAESLVFLAATGLITAGAARFFVSVPAVAAVLFVWFVLFLGWLRLHVRHTGQYTLILFIAPLLGLFLHEFPNMSAREWVYLGAPFFNTSIFHLPLWVWFGWYFLVLGPLRLWIFVVLNPRVR